MLDQAHLCPLPPLQRPVYWNYDYALRLYPVPGESVLCFDTHAMLCTAWMPLFYLRVLFRSLVVLCVDVCASFDRCAGLGGHCRAVPVAERWLYHIQSGTVFNWYVAALAGVCHGCRSLPFPPYGLLGCVDFIFVVYSPCKSLTSTLSGGKMDAAPDDETQNMSTRVEFSRIDDA